MARVTTKKCGKPKPCGACRKMIPKGENYRYAKPGFRGRLKVRCMAEACRFRPTDLSDSKAARIEEAVEDAQTAVEAATDQDEISSALEECGQVAQEVADEYQEASDNWAGGNGNEQFTTWADNASSFADECSGWSPSGDEPDTAETDAKGEVEREDGESDADFEERQNEAGEQACEEALQAMKDEASEILSSYGGLD